MAWSQRTKTEGQPEGYLLRAFTQGIVFRLTSIAPAVIEPPFGNIDKRLTKRRPLIPARNKGHFQWSKEVIPRLELLRRYV